MNDYVLTYIEEHGPIVVGGAALSGNTCCPTLLALRKHGKKLLCVEMVRVNKVSNYFDFDPQVMPHSLSLIEKILHPIPFVNCHVGIHDTSCEWLRNLVSQYYDRISQIKNGEVVKGYKVVVPQFDGFASIFSPWYEWRIERWQFVPRSMQDSELGGLYAFYDREEAIYSAQSRANSMKRKVSVFSAEAYNPSRSWKKMHAELMRITEHEITVSPQE